MPIPVDMRNLVCMSVDLIGSPSKPDFQNMYVIPNRSIQLRWCLGIAEGPTMDRLCWQEINLILPRSMDWGMGRGRWGWWCRESASVCKLCDTVSDRIKCPYLIWMGCKSSTASICFDQLFELFSSNSRSSHPPLYVVNQPIPSIPTFRRVSHHYAINPITEHSLIRIAWVHHQSCEGTCQSKANVLSWLRTWTWTWAWTWMLMWTCHRRRVELSIKKMSVAKQKSSNTKQTNRRWWKIALDSKLAYSAYAWTPAVSSTWNSHSKQKALTFGVACCDH